MDNFRIGTVLSRRQSKEWVGSALALEFALTPCSPDQAESVSATDILLFDMDAAEQYRHWLDLYRRHLAPDSPPLILLHPDQPIPAWASEYFDGVLSTSMPVMDIVSRLREWGALHYSAKIWTQIATGQAGRPAMTPPPEPPVSPATLPLPDMLHPQLFSQLSQMANQGMFVCDNDGMICFVNAALCQLTGYTAPALIGQSVQVLLPRLAHGGRFAEFRSHVRQWKGWEGELVGLGKDGEHLQVWLQVQVAAECQEGGTVRTFYTGVFTDLASSRKLESCILQLSRTDSLSDLNRILFEEKLTLDIAAAQAQGRTLALLHIELPEYRLLTEQFGNNCCHQVLARQMERISRVVGQHGFCSRISESHYGVIVTSTRLAKSAGLLAARLVSELAQPVMLESMDILCPGVVGYSLFPEQAKSADELLRNADLAAKWCQDNPTVRLRGYTPDLRDYLEHDLTVLMALKQALESRDFFLLYQPQIDLQTGEMLGVEALVRWRRVDGSIAEPKDFITLAEENGLIIALTHQILELACNQLKLWLADGLKLKMSVNISAVHFQYANLVEDIRACLQHSDIPPGYLELEVTEHCLIKDLDSAITTLTNLKALGITIALDDFGTGYSSLGYMKRFPIDRLKIDQSFIRDLSRENVDAVIVRAIIALGHAMGYRVIAEGVETPEQLEYLRLMRCNEVQGFLFSYPVLAEEIPATLQRLRTVNQPINRPAGTTRYLLLIDDEQPILNALRRNLHGEGYQILLATTAEEAWHQLAHNPVGVVVCDNRMPGTSGLTLLRQMKERYPLVVRIMLSGYADLLSLSEAINSGEIMRFLAKPWDDQELKLAIHDAFVRHEQETRAYDKLV